MRLHAGFGRANSLQSGELPRFLKWRRVHRVDRHSTAQWLQGEVQDHEGCRTMRKSSRNLTPSGNGQMEYLTSIPTLNPKNHMLFSTSLPHTGKYTTKSATSSKSGAHDHSSGLLSSVGSSMIHITEMKLHQNGNASSFCGSVDRGISEKPGDERTVIRCLSVK